MWDEMAGDEGNKDSPLSEFADAQPEFADTRPLPTFLQ